MTIWKYPLPHGCGQLFLPEGAQILSVQMQHGQFMLWALVDPAASLQQRRFRTFGTGWDLPENWKGKHLATLQNEGLVWHVFEELA